MAAAEPGGYRDRFQVQKEIGEGGFAHVYRARELATGRQVALKVLKESFLSNNVIVERFRREVFAVASISSPHVVAMYDFGMSGDEVWIAMEYVEGTTLRQLLGERTFRTEEIHLVIGQIAQALAAAHRQNIVHRDLKPENVMLVAGPDGARQVKVLDFGLAKLAELERQLDLEPLTRVGMCFGTPQYMAPELIQGRPPDHAVDLYALGVMTFEMFAGRLPFDGDDPMQVLMSVVKTPVPHLERPIVATPRRAELDRFLQRALAKEKRDRPPDASTFFRELEQALFGKERPGSRSGVRVPKEDEAFRSVWAAAITLEERESDTEVDGMRGGRVQAELDVSTSPGTFSGKTHTGTHQRRRLSSSWLQSLAELPPPPPPTRGPLDLDSVELDETRRFTPEALEDIQRSMSAASPMKSRPGFESAVESTDQLGDRGRGRAARPRAGGGATRMQISLVVFVFGLVTLALALGYWLGQRH
jgi:serine/threonine protein kinase